MTNPGRSMSRAEFWMNFRLGDELSVSGAFIYNGLRRFHEMRSLGHADELFEFLYATSVGLERLLKVAVVLHEHDDGADPVELEKSLITHNHMVLLTRLKKKATLSLGPAHFEFLALLAQFYKSLRYNRFTLASTFSSRQERAALILFLEKYLQTGVGVDTFTGTANDDKQRKFLRKVIIRISQNVYEVIKARASALGIFTYELRHGSKAETVFLQQVDIANEDVIWKEMLIFLMNTPSTSGYLEFLRSIEPLDFDPELVDDYLDCFKSDVSKAMVMDELEHRYQELQGKAGERLELIGVIGAPGVSFNREDDAESEAADIDPEEDGTTTLD